MLRVGVGSFWARAADSFDIDLDCDRLVVMAGIGCIPGIDRTGDKVLEILAGSAGIKPGV